MKTISLGYEEYKNELDEQFECGKEAGISLVMKWLESNKSLRDFLSAQGWDDNYLRCLHKDERLHWNRILKSLNRDFNEAHPTTP